MGIEWSPKLSVGVESIDMQHKELFARVNKLLQAMTSQQSDQEVKRIVAFLGEYVVSHFSAEEKLMAQHRYPDEAKHKKAHADFMKDLGKIKAELDKNGTSGLLAIDLNHKVCSWLIDHIGQTDRALGAFLQAKKAQAAAR